MALAEHVQDTIRLKTLDTEPGTILATLFQGYHEEKEERPKTTFEYSKSIVKTIFNSDDNGAAIKCAKLYADSLTEEKGVPSGRNLFDHVNHFFPEKEFSHARDSFVRVLQGFAVFHPDTLGLLSEYIRERVSIVPWQPFDKDSLNHWVRDLINRLPQNQIIPTSIGGGNDREMRENAAHMLSMLRSFLLPEHYQDVFDALKSRVVGGTWGSKDSQPAVREAAMSTLVTLSPLFSAELRQQLPQMFFENLKSKEQGNREAAGRVFVQYIRLYPEGQETVLDRMIVFFHQDKNPDVRRAAIKVMACICRETPSPLLRTRAFDAVQAGLWEKNDPAISHYTAQVLQDDLADVIPDAEKELLARTLSSRLYSDDPVIQTMATTAVARMPNFFCQLPEEMVLDDLDLFLSKLLLPIKDDSTLKKYSHSVDVGESKEDVLDVKNEQDDIVKQPYLPLKELLNAEVDLGLQVATLDVLKHLANIILPKASIGQQRKWMMGLLAACHYPDRQSTALEALLSCFVMLTSRDADFLTHLQKNIATTMIELIEMGTVKNSRVVAAIIGHLFPESGSDLQEMILMALFRIRKESGNAESRKAATLALMSVYSAVEVNASSVLAEILDTVVHDEPAVKETVLEAMPTLLLDASAKNEVVSALNALEESMTDANTAWPIRAKIAICLLGRSDDATIVPVLLQQAMNILTEALESALIPETRAHILSEIKTLHGLPWQENVSENETPKSRLFRTFVNQLENPDTESIVVQGIKDWVEAGEEGILTAVFAFLTKKLCMQTTPSERVLYARILSTTLERINEQQTNQHFFRLFDKVARHWLDIQRSKGVAGTGLEVMGLVCANHASQLLAKPALVYEEVHQERREMRAAV